MSGNEGRITKFETGNYQLSTAKATPLQVAYSIATRKSMQTFTFRGPDDSRHASSALDICERMSKKSKWGGWSLNVSSEIHVPQISFANGRQGWGSVDWITRPIIAEKGRLIRIFFIGLSEGSWTKGWCTILEAWSERILVYLSAKNQKIYTSHKAIHHDAHQSNL